MTLEMKLELVPVPVTDIDRAKAFYVDKAAFAADHDMTVGEGVRIVQLTPPGSGCSVLLWSGLPGMDMVPGSQRGFHLVVKDIRAAREELAGRGVEMGEIDDMGGVLYSAFSDPDGNTWTLQQIPG
ncbi:VOC family protein [Amycolatopsis sp. H20-H5]|uniref:VOC family protein n=1 Tax=Amycolatopsis sp. H20-H5 TaxID=3046309 RepID=UPI002DBEBBF2|nr:VOC family protein [Amycolatopsis sp. H20-H5]MEC3977284.1 VOC family protein [Amycolatopsis sp. H20-H5]